MYKCSCCGSCCRNIGGIELYSDLDNGMGICKNLDLETNLCKIYKSRPLKCRIDDSYKVLFKDILSIEEYYKMNYEACEKLREKI